MTFDGRAAACLRCGKDAPRLIRTELVHSCNQDLQVVEWSECARCCQWLDLSVWERGERRVD